MRFGRASRLGRRNPVAGYVALAALFLALEIWLTQSHDTGSILFVLAVGSLIGAWRVAKANRQRS